MYECLGKYIYTFIYTFTFVTLYLKAIKAIDLQGSRFISLLHLSCHKKHSSVSNPHSKPIVYLF